MYSRHKPRGAFWWLANPFSDVMSWKRPTYFRTYQTHNRQTPSFFDDADLKWPRTEIFFQSHLSARNMFTLQHLRVISGSLSTNVFLVVLGICTLLFSRWISTRRLNLPPGPRPDPFIGNLRQISLNRQELCFTEWGSIFGTVVAYAAFPSHYC